MHKYNSTESYIIFSQAMHQIQPPDKSQSTPYFEQKQDIQVVYFVLISQNVK